MDSAALISKVSQRLPGAILSKQRFGKTGTLCAWIEAKQILNVARGLKEDREGAMDWLEHLGVAQLGNDFILNYFLRSSRARMDMVLRVSIKPETPMALMELPSVSSVWPMARSFEQEVSELFGIQFTGEPMVRSLLPDTLQGFPLRKGAEWPKS